MHSFSPKVINYSKEEGLESCFMSNALSDMRESKTISMIFCHAILVRDKNPFIVVSKIASLQLPEMISTMAFIFKYANLLHFGHELLQCLCEELCI